jgi:3-oxoacyl-[acyl-carrier protein] reductase
MASKIAFIKRIYRYLRYGIPVINRQSVYAEITNLSQNELLKGRTALITGGTSGIGLEIAKAFINAGATIIITSRSDKHLRETQEKLPNGSPCYYFILDIRDTNQINQCIPKIVQEFGIPQIDILVNNAGINHGTNPNCFEDNFDEIIETNLRGSYLLVKVFAQYFKDNKITGNILNIASSSSDRPATDAYTLSKWGIKGLTKGLARVYSQYGIVVNGIAPGPTATPMIKGDDTSNELTHEKGLTGRMTHPVEVANMAVILVSNISRMVIGDIVYMSGGLGNVYTEDVEYHF